MNEKTIKGWDIIRENTYNESQSWHYELIIGKYSKRLWLQIRRNAYDFQSYAKISLWSGERWQLVYNEPIEYCECSKVSYIDKKVTRDAFIADAERIIGIAESILL